MHASLSVDWTKLFCTEPEWATGLCLQLALCFFLSPAPAAAPQNPSSTTLNSTAIQVQWEVVPEIDRNGIITNYEVRVDPAQFQSVRYENVSGSDLVLVVDELEEFVEYNFTIRGYTSAGPGPFSNVTTNTTDQAGEWIVCRCVQDAHSCIYYIILLALFASARI